MRSLPVTPSVWTPPPRPQRADQRHGAQLVDLQVFDLPGAGPEDVAIDAAGHVLAGVEDGRILRIAPDGSRIDTMAHTGGRPLGIEIDADGDLIVCDARRGVLRVRGDRVEPMVEKVAGDAMLFCNNSALGRDGSVYFTDSSRHFGIDEWRGELFAHTGTGRLFRRTPDGAVDLLCDGLEFANGVALAPDESWLAVAQTTAYCLDRIWLTGPRAGQREPFVTNLPGFPDNISTGTDGLIWVALPSPRDKTLDLLLPRAPLLRSLAWKTPERLQPQPAGTVWVQAYDAEGTLVHDLQTTHHSLHTVTGVREIDGRVWLGSLTASALGVINLG